MSAVEDHLAKDRCVDQQLVVLEYGQVCLRIQDGLDVGDLFDVVDGLDGPAEVHLCYFWIEVQNLKYFLLLFCFFKSESPNGNSLDPLLFLLIVIADKFGSFQGAEENIVVLSEQDCKMPEGVRNLIRQQQLSIRGSISEGGIGDIAKIILLYKAGVVDVEDDEVVGPGAKCHII